MATPGQKHDHGQRQTRWPFSYSGLPRRGFTLVEIAIVLVVFSALLVPGLQLLLSSRESGSAGKSQLQLEAARDALIAYAAQHQGCLPHAADFEGGVPDTGQTGVSGYADTGSVRQAGEPTNAANGQRAGDLPWADIGFGNGLDGNGYRIQYYVATGFTSSTQTRLSADTPAARSGCPARASNGVEIWSPNFRYGQGDFVQYSGLYYVATAVNPPVGAGNEPLGSGSWAALGGTGAIATWDSLTAYVVGNYVNDENRIYRAIAASTNRKPATSGEWLPVSFSGFGYAPPAWQTGQAYRRGELVTEAGRVFRALAVNTPAATAPTNGANWLDVSLPPNNAAPNYAKSLETRVGPDVGAAPGNTPASAHNVFVLIAPGKNINPQIANRLAVRDPNHQTCTGPTTCANWNALNAANVDNASFSLTANTQNVAEGHDRVLAVSFSEFQARLNKMGVTLVGYRR